MLLSYEHVYDKLTFWPDHSVLSGLFAIISLPDCPVKVFSCFLSNCSSFFFCILLVFITCFTKNTNKD